MLKIHQNKRNAYNVIKIPSKRHEYMDILGLKICIQDLTKQKSLEVEENPSLKLKNRRAF